MKILNPSQEPQVPFKAPIRKERKRMFFAPSKLMQTAKIGNMGVSKTSDFMQIQIKSLNGSLKDMDVHCAFKIKIASQNSNHDCMKNQ